MLKRAGYAIGMCVLSSGFGLMACWHGENPEAICFGLFLAWFLIAEWYSGRWRLVIKTVPQLYAAARGGALRLRPPASYIAFGSILWLIAWLGILLFSRRG